MREQSPEIDLARPLGGRLGLVLVGAVALAGLIQGLGSILWTGLALPPSPPPAPAEDVNPLLREAPAAPKPAAPAAEAPRAEATKAPEPEPAPKNEVEAVAPKPPVSSAPPYGPPSGNTTAAPAQVLPVEPAPAQPAPAQPVPAPPVPEDQPPL